MGYIDPQDQIQGTQDMGHMGGFSLSPLEWGGLPLKPRSNDPLEGSQDPPDRGQIAPK